jgi:hypothetical protein
MNKPKLIDMFGLSGERANDDQLDDLFCRLESETLSVSNGISKSKRSLPFTVTIQTPVFEPRQISFNIK